MTDLQGKRIFIVEDDLTNMAVYAATLKRSGALIIQDFWNADTVRMLKQHLPVDLIVLDLMLRKEVSGYDIFDAIKREADLAHIPVVAVSAADPSIEMPRARQRGFTGFISKPISVADFTHQVAHLIAGEQVWFAQ